MSFYVYENWVAAKKAVIHKGTCSFCNNGEGTGRNMLGEENGRWHGAFDNYETAKIFAQSLRDRIFKNCSFCKPPAG